jgi:hypothetical protein
MTTPPARKLTTSIRVGCRFRCIISLDLAELDAEEAPIATCRWAPRVPKKLSEREMADYRRGRNAFVAEVARLSHSRIVVGDLTTGHIALIEPSEASARAN